MKLTENIFFFPEVTLGALVELREIARAYFIDDIVELQINSRFWKNLNTLDLNEICSTKLDNALALERNIVSSKFQFDVNN